MGRHSHNITLTKQKHLTHNALTNALGKTFEHHKDITPDKHTVILWYKEKRMLLKKKNGQLIYFIFMDEQTSFCCFKW